MTLRSDVRHGVRIGRAEFVRSLRRYVGNPRRLVGVGVVLLFFGGNLLFTLPAAYVFGRSARSVAAIPYLAPAATASLIGLLGLAALRTLERIGSVEAENLLLLTVHPRAIVVGLLTAEVGRLLLWFGVPLVGFVAAFALGLGSPSLLVTAGLVVLPMVCWAAVWGYALGLGGLRILRRLPNARRALKAGGILAMVGLVVASQFVGRYAVEGDVSIQAVLDVFRVGPVTDYVALAFVGTPLARPPSVGAITVLVGLVALTPVGLHVATRQAAACWFTDVTRREDDSRPATSEGGFAPPRPFAGSGAGHVAWGILLRGVRHPQELAHLVMIVFFVGPLGTTVVQSSHGALGPLLAGTGVGLGTYLAGATFGLNPLGDDRPQLPLSLLTGTDPRTLVRGRVLAGVAVGLPVAVLVPLASVLLGTTPLQSAVFATIGVGMCVAAALFAVGLGSAYPIYEEREFWGTETVVPSTLVMMVYLFVVGIGTVLGLVATWYALAGALALTGAGGVAVAVYVLLTGGVSYGSYRYAVGRYRGYTFD